MRQAAGQLPIRRLSPPWSALRVSRIVVLAGFLLGGLYLVRFMKFAPFELFDGLFREDGYLSRALPPTFTSTNSLGQDPRSEWGVTLNALVRTLIMACGMAAPSVEAGRLGAVDGIADFLFLEISL